MNRYLSVITLFLALGLTACSGSSPEAVVRKVYKAAADRDFSSIRDNLTSTTLRKLLKTDGKKWSFNRYCSRLTGIPSKAESIVVHFMRSNYFNNRSRAVVSFFVSYRYYKRTKTLRLKWVLRKRAGGWKIVAF